MTKPSDEKLYNKIKRELYSKYPKHSAYRSGLLVQNYKKAFFQKYHTDPNKSPYIGPKPTKKSGGLKRWFAEEWKNQEGKVGYHSPFDVYRPTKKITKKTPITFKELSIGRLNKARIEKFKTDRVKKF